jgi:hypothetical protein
MPADIYPLLAPCPLAGVKPLGFSHFFNLIQNIQQPDTVSQRELLFKKVFAVINIPIYVWWLVRQGC